MDTSMRQTIGQLRQTLLTKWPDAVLHCTVPATFVGNERNTESGSPLRIAFGQIVELTGDESSGKTSLAARLCPALIGEPVCWFALAGSMFAVPHPGMMHGEAQSLKEAITVCLAIIGAAAFQRIVLDLSNAKETKDIRRDFTPKWYLLRRTVVRQYAQLVILTPDDIRLLPESVVTKRILASRNSDGAINVQILKSRTGGEGMYGDIANSA
jgi:hypothetical protein